MHPSQLTPVLLGLGPLLLLLARTRTQDLQLRHQTTVFVFGEFDGVEHSSLLLAVHLDCLLELLDLLQVFGLLGLQRAHLILQPLHVMLLLVQLCNEMAPFLLQLQDHLRFFFVGPLELLLHALQRMLQAGQLRIGFALVAIELLFVRLELSLQLADVSL